MPRYQDQKIATIADGQTVSDAVYTGDKQPVAIVLPASMTGNAISFQGSWDGTDYVAINTGGSAYSVSIASSKVVELDPAKFAGVRFVKLVSGSAESGAKAIGLQLKHRSI